MSSVIDNNFPNDRTKLKGGYAMIDMCGLLTNSEEDQTIHDGGALWAALFAVVKSNKPIILCNMKINDGALGGSPLSPISVYAVLVDETVAIYSPSRTARPYMVYRDTDEDQTITVIE